MGLRLRDLCPSGVRTGRSASISTLTSSGWASCSRAFVLTSRTRVTPAPCCISDAARPAQSRRRTPTTPTGSPPSPWPGGSPITRDRHIQDHRAELAAVRENRLRMVALSAPEARTTWEQLEVVMCQWHAIEALADREGPLLYLATRTSLRPISLQ